MYSDLARHGCNDKKEKKHVDYKQTGKCNEMYVSEPPYLLIFMNEKKSGCIRFVGVAHRLTGVNI